MRTLLKITVDTTAGNSAIANGTLPELMKNTIQKLNPEASYFYPSEGLRTAIFIFDLKDPSLIVQINEPFWTVLKAKVEMYPVMNADDLQKGLQTAMKSQYAVAQ